MFSSFTSYLFGYSAEEETNESLPVQKEEEESSVEVAQTQNSDDEWELVEKESTGEGTRTDISSMENLLIEHPSMSVYGPRHRLNSEGSESCCSQSSQENEGSDNQQSNNLNRTGRSLKVIRHPPRRVHAITTRIGLATQSSKNQRKSQVIQRQNFSHSISRSSLRRSNKVAQKTQRHKQATPRVLYQPSKCCVRF